ncbi:hypothetical protein WD019_04545 [Fictibacillus sp. Mic-4]|uniref:hypothetical protein n=1 Tax=Fictibacillus sp. Mic-4 TaxID=3132826 RepID=UPI003CE967E4
MESVIYAGDTAAMRKLSEFRSLDDFNMYYRQLKLTIKSELRPSWERILDQLFEASCGMIGVTFFRRLTLAERAECGKTSLDDFQRYAKKRGFLRIVRAQSPKDGKKKRGGDAHLVYVFQPIEDLLDLPCEEDTSTRIDREPFREALFGSRRNSKKACDSTAGGKQNESLSSFSFSKNSKKELNTYIEDVKDVQNTQIFQNENTIDFKNYEQDAEIFAVVAGVPEEVISELSRGFGTTEIIELWVSIRRTLTKYKAKFEDYSDAIVEAIRSTINAYKRKSSKGERFNFARYLCGTIKRIIAKNLKQNIEERRSLPTTFGYNWLAQPTENEYLTANLLGVIDDILADGVDFELPY